MGDVFGSVTDAFGLTDYEGQERAERQSRDALQRSIMLQEDIIDFSKEQYEDWKNIYGPIQENLGEYYKNLTPEKLVARNLEASQQEYQRAMEKIGENFAQRGLAGSGLEIAEQTRGTLQQAGRRATIRASGDELVNQQKMNFLSLGLGQGANLGSNVTSAYGQSLGATSGVFDTSTGQATTIGGRNQEFATDLAGTLAGSFL